MQSFYKVDDCAYGLPAVKDFINASIVAFSSSAPGTTAQIQVPDQLKTTQDVKKNIHRKTLRHTGCRKRYVELSVYCLITK